MLYKSSYMLNLVRYAVLIQDRIFEKKKQTILRFIKKHGKVDHSFILNEVNVDYDTLMKIITDLRNEGRLD